MTWVDLDIKDNTILEAEKTKILEMMCLLEESEKVTNPHKKMEICELVENHALDIGDCFSKFVIRRIAMAGTLFCRQAQESVARLIKSQEQKEIV